MENIRLQEDNILQLAEHSFQAVRNVIEQLRNHVAETNFVSVEEEIYFFKEIKPQFYSKLIYYLKVFAIETRRPTGSTAAEEKYLQKELNRLKHFFDDNLDFYQYYRSGATYLDKKYFLRGKIDIHFSPDTYYYSADPKFSTSHDYKVSRIIANELVRIYLISALGELEQKDDEHKMNGTQKAPFSWTAPKASLIELIYALQALGVYNNGSADVKQIATTFERMFNIDLGNYYNVFQEIRMRKKNQTSFLDKLKEKLIQRIDEADGD